GQRPVPGQPRVLHRQRRDWHWPLRVHAGRPDHARARGMTRTPWVVGVSGASGTPYARSVLLGLLDAGEPVDLVVSRAARLTLLDETGLAFRDAHWRDDLAACLGRSDGSDVQYWPAGDLAAGPSSG